MINSNDIHVTLPAITSSLEMEMSEEPQHSLRPCQLKSDLNLKLRTLNRRTPQYFNPNIITVQDMFKFGLYFKD